MWSLSLVVADYLRMVAYLGLFHMDKRAALVSARPSRFRRYLNEAYSNPPTCEWQFDKDTRVAMRYEDNAIEWTHVKRALLQ
jgi:hypothetical protein